MKWSPAALAEEYRRVRQQSLRLCEPLEIEDHDLQAAAFTSPPKWHLAHTTWFFETFVLKPFRRGYQPWHPAFEHLFNSYYNGIGQPFPRPRRGLLSRPTVAEVYRYRRAVDEQILELLDRADEVRSECLQRIELGLHHEQQHQELILTDLKYSFSFNPLRPAYREAPPACRITQDALVLDWHTFEGGLVTTGACDERFCFDNETPAHTVFLQPFQLAGRLVTNAEYQAFITDGGYRCPELWLADGWSRVQAEAWVAPLYWRHDGDGWLEFSLWGELPVQEASPVCHLSYYEADAYARWMGARLPTEAEWEFAASPQPVAGNLLGSGYLQPCPAESSSGLQQLFGDVWEWTVSSYSPYPGYRPPSGAIGEYNGKFMSGQQVLRGGSCVSDMAHIRASYRNFFYPPDRWQFSGVRLARSL